MGIVFGLELVDEECVDSSQAFQNSLVLVFVLCSIAVKFEYESKLRKSAEVDRDFAAKHLVI